jgi:predicted Zn-dependent protease
MALMASTSVEPDPALGMTEAKRNDFSKKLIELYQANYPNDPAIELAAVDYYVNTEQFDSAVRSIDSVDKVVGGDPYLDTIRARVHLQQGDLKAARAAAERSLKKCPDLLPPYVAVAEIAMDQGEIDRVSQVSATASDKFGINIREIIEHKESATKNQ